MAYTRTKRSLKAKNQARDRFGRWVSVGANVRWNTNGKDFAGVIDKIDGDEAKIIVKHPDGTESNTSILMSRLRVLASKATIPKDEAKFHDKGNNFAKALENPAVAKAVEEHGAAAIERVDGYKLTMALRIPKDAGNPIMYQLFGPGGVSLGQYTDAAIPDFDGMVAEDQSDGEAAPDVVVASVETTPFTVPASVRSVISEALGQENTLSAEDIDVASRLANNQQVSLSDVQWVHNFFSSTELDEKARGGFKGKKWATKILDDPEKEEKDTYSLDDSVLEYFATSSEEGSEVVEKLFAIDREAGTVLKWNGALSVVVDLSVDHFEAPTIIALSGHDAGLLAERLDSGAASVNVLDLDPLERNLFELAAPEMDLEELDMLTAVLADATGYSPIERSVNAQKQHRGPGGIFGGQPKPVEGGPAPVADSPAQKSTLPEALPLIEDLGQLITTWISTASEAPVMASGEEAPADPTGPEGEAIYFAIVDNVDQTAVLDAVAIVKIEGAPAAFLRTSGEWVNSPNTLLDFKGDTPPPVVKLGTPDTLKSVLSQIDTYDEEKKTEIEEEAVVASGFALLDGSLVIVDADTLSAAVLSTDNPTLQQKVHIRKRALALNRMDLLPADMRTLTLAERGETAASATLFGEFGEVIPLVAGGVPGVADTPGDFKNVAKLKNYWAFGRGAAKVRWGTPGDLTRAHKHLAKYVGPRAWGLAQNIHKLRFGVSNITHDRATGQYRPRRRK